MDYMNKLVIKGRVGADPTVRYLPSGDPVVNFSVATMHNQHVEWHAIVGYKELAERAKAEFSAGDVVYIEGRIETREFQTADDKEHNRKARKVREVIADAMSLVQKSKKNLAQKENQLPQESDQAQDSSFVNDSDTLPPAAHAVPSYI